MYELCSNSLEGTQSPIKINDCLVPPEDQHIRNMRHHIHCKDLHGVIGYHPNIENSNDDLQLNNKRNTEELVKNNCTVYLGSDIISTDKDKHQLDMLAYTYPYHMLESINMLPSDCHSEYMPLKQLDTLEARIKQFNVRHPLLQL